MISGDAGRLSKFAVWPEVIIYNKIDHIGVVRTILKLYSL